MRQPIFVALMSFAVTTTTAFADVAVDGSFKGTIAGIADGGRDLGLGSSKDHQQGYIDLTPWVHLQFGQHWGLFFRPEGYAQTGALLRPGNDANNVQTDTSSSGNSKYGFVGLKEAWIEYTGITDYPGEFFRVGRQRIRQDDGEWWDTDIDAARWVFDTTQIQAEFGGARQFNRYSYRSDRALLPKDQRDRTYVFGSIGGEWLERNRLTMRAVYAKDDKTPHLAQTDAEFNPNAKREHDNIAWIGLTAHDHYFDWKRPPHFGYWAQAIVLTGNQTRSRVLSTTDPNTGITTTTLNNPPTARTTINAWATEGGLKICMPRRWPIQFGGLYAYSTGARGQDANGDQDPSKQFFQTGVESNYSRFTGTRSLIHRFNEAYRAELGNLMAGTAFAAIDVGHYDASAVFNQFWRTEGGAPVVSDGITVQPVNGKSELGRGYDLVMTRYFSVRSDDLLESHEGEAESSAIRLRGSLFTPGAAYHDDTHKPHDEYRAVVELVLWF